MKIICFILLILLYASVTFGAGFANSENFLILVPSVPDYTTGQQIAENTLNIAEKHRRQIALEWLGKELEPKDGRTTINISYHKGPERALTWAIDDSRRKLHGIYIRTIIDRSNIVIEEMLPHEIAHIVLATHFNHFEKLGRYSPWLEEGIASHYDDSERIQLRLNQIKIWKNSQQIPSLINILDLHNIRSNNIDQYAISVSLVDFLVHRKDKSTLLKFDKDGQKIGWSLSLQKYYNIKNINHLQKLWEKWVLNHG